MTIRGRRSCWPPTTIRAACSRRCARSMAMPAPPSTPISSWSASGCSTDSISPALVRSSCRTCCCARSACAAEGRTAEASDLDERVAAVREKVPAEHREEFDELLGEARLTYRVRDERGVFSDIWASGLHAACRAARAAAGSPPPGACAKPTTWSTPSIAEMCRAAVGRRRPLGRRARRASRVSRTRTTRRTPRRSSASRRRRPPDPSGLPPAVARVMRATGIAMGEMFGSSEEEHDGGRAPRAGGEPRRV